MHPANARAEERLTLMTARQSGQRSCPCLSALPQHAAWNSWPHGARHTAPASRNGSKQSEHVSPDWQPGDCPSE